MHSEMYLDDCWQEIADQIRAHLDRHEKRLSAHLLEEIGWGMPRIDAHRAYFNDDMRRGLLRQIVTIYRDHGRIRFVVSDNCVYGLCVR